METDVLVGLRFELSGGLGKMAGVILGKAGALYLVQRDGADHLELLELSDLRSARFYGDIRKAERAATSAMTSLGSAGGPSGGGRLSDKIRRSAAGDESDAR